MVKVLLQMHSVCLQLMGDIGYHTVILVSAGSLLIYWVFAEIILSFKSFLKMNLINIIMSNKCKDNENIEKDYRKSIQWQWK